MFPPPHQTEPLAGVVVLDFLKRIKAKTKRKITAKELSDWPDEFAVLAPEPMPELWEYMLIEAGYRCGGDPNQPDLYQFSRVRRRFGLN